MKKIKKEIPDKEYIFFEVEKEFLRFYEVSDQTEKFLGSVKIEWNYLMGQFVRNVIPGEAEIENTINYIEDELMRDPGLLNNKKLNLYTGEEKFVELLGQAKTQTEYNTRQIEDEFTPYALLSMGRSPVYAGVEVNNERYMVLLILREILHHLKFTSIRIIRRNDGVPQR